jgi:uncharacterized protein
LRSLASALILSALWLGATAPAPALAQSGLRAIPPLTGPVIDEAGLLSGAQKTALADELRAYLPQLQLQIWVMDTLGPEAIEALSIRAADQWKLGTAKDDRGAMILVALQDRQMRIEVGQGLEGEIPDAAAGRIIDQVLAPHFRAQDFAGGLQAAARELYQRAGGDVSQLSPAPSFHTPRRSRQGFSWFHVVIFLVILLMNAFRGRRRGVGFLTGMLLGHVSGGRSRSSWGGGGGGGWSGGGGGFSGGGSSGRW